MPAPFTVVTLVDEDGDEFPIRLPSVYHENRGADIEAAMQILHDDHKNDLQKPKGAVEFGSIEYVGETQEAAR